MTQLTAEEKRQLICRAQQARAFAQAPYSHFTVGAALLAADGRVFTGCNVENAAYSPTNCAERTALFKAVSEGVTQFTHIAVIGGAEGTTSDTVTAPCGVCRQALYEFCGPELVVLMARTPDEYIERTLGELLPFAFGRSNLA